MFLPFGTIAPGILLSLLGFAYMLFFGSFALNKVSKNEQPEKPAKIFTTERHGVSSSEATAFYFPATDDDHIAVAQQTGNPAVNEPGTCILVKIPDEDPCRDTHQFLLFARPPPFTAIA